MLCKKCGQLVEDPEARFCSECGADLTLQVEEAPVEQAPVEPVVSEPAPVEPTPVTPVEPAPVEQSPVEPAPVQNASEFTDKAPTEITVEEVTPVEEKPKKKGLFVAFAAIFAIISIAAAICELIPYNSTRTNEIEVDIKNWAVIVNLVVFMVASIVVLVYAFTKTKAVAIIKGILMLVVLGANLFLIGLETFTYAQDSLSYDGATVLDKYTGIMIMVTFVLFYLFLFLDFIRSTFSINKMTSAMSFIGYFVILLFVLTSVLLTVGFNFPLALGFVPMYTYAIAFAAADIFAGVARKRA